VWESCNPDATIVALSQFVAQFFQHQLLPPNTGTSLSFHWLVIQPVRLMQATRHGLPRSTIISTAVLQHLALTQPGFDTTRPDGRRWSRALSQRSDDGDHRRRSETLCDIQNSKSWEDIGRTERNCRPMQDLQQGILQGFAPCMRGSTDNSLRYKDRHRYSLPQANCGQASRVMRALLWPNAAFLGGPPIPADHS